MKSKQLFLAATLIYLSVVFALSGMNIADSIQSSSSNFYAESVYNTSSLAQQSDLVVTGEVSDIKTRFSEGNEIVRDVEIKIEEVLKGEEKNSLEVRAKGGKIGDYKSVSSTAPSFRQNEKVLLFLADMDRGYVVKGGEYGKLNIENGIIEREDIPEKYDQRLNLTELTDEIRSKYG